MTRIECKCQTCNEHTSTCHSTCPDYKKFQEENEKRKTELKSQKELYSCNYMKKLREKKFGQV